VQLSRNHLRLFMFSGIVVNAAITVCRFNPSAVKLTTGTVEGGRRDVISAIHQISIMPTLGASISARLAPGELLEPAAETGAKRAVC
jgi:hypothetical protein